MRAIKRHSIKLNLGKNNLLQSMTQAYAKEKQCWLYKFQQRTHIPYIKHHRAIRDQAILSKYQSAYGLQARMWKLALQDAADTMDKYWKSIFDKIKRHVYQSTLSDLQRHYGFWLLKDYARLAEVLSFHTPLFKELAFKERKQVISYLNRQIRTHKKQYPKVKKVRSFLLDDNCYGLFEHNGRQYIQLMTLTPRKRLAIPLSGKTPIRGNIRIIVKGSIVEVHYTSDIKSIKRAHNDSVIAIDFGYTEVMTDSDGDQYGTQLGNVLTNASDSLKTKMQRRHKLHALQKKYAQSNKIEHKIKARNISRNNLGRTKLEETQQKLTATCSCEINTAFNQLMRKNINTIVSESLSHTFAYHRGSNWNRRLSAWVRGKLKERLEFKALVKGFSQKTVNPAYTSQTCPLCDYVDRKNRKGDKFQCLYCRYENHADRVAAMNLKSRYFDREITLYMPYNEVKKILLARFRRRLESGLPGTVSARIPDTAAT
jgi:putative transposase